MRKTSIKLLVIAITAAAIIASVTTISAATPAFAKIRETCDTSTETCTRVGGTSIRQEGADIPGGHGGRTVFDSSTTIFLGGSGQGPVEGGGNVGGFGFNTDCTTFPVSSCSKQVGGSGLHEKGPGGNSDNVPPQ